MPGSKSSPRVETMSQGAAPRPAAIRRRAGTCGPPPDHLWIGRRSRQFAPSRRLTNVPELRTPQRRSSNANSLRWRVLAKPRRVITPSQILGSYQDS
jgi:hypothetical protein